MTLWLIPAGSRGEHEQKFLDESRVYVAWDGLDVDLGALLDRQGLIRVMEDRFPDEKAKALVNWSSQVWPCLFVSWSGFKPNVQRELAASFFKVRLWSRKDLLEKLYAN